MVKQVSVFLENKAGRLAAVANCLAQKNLNIRALSVADTQDFGILRLIVNNPDEAYEALKNAGFTVSTTEVIAVEMSDTPGGLAAVLDVMQETGINIEYLYAFVSHMPGLAMVIFKVEKPEEAVRHLEEHGIKVIAEKELYEM
jgi:hypothetical protein